MRKKNYEVCGKTYSSLASIEEAKENKDYETFTYILADNYRDAVRKAKEFSKRIGETIKGDYGNKELTEVSVMCYEENETTYYEQIFEEIFENGEKVERFYFETF